MALTPVSLSISATRILEGHSEMSFYTDSNISITDFCTVGETETLGCSNQRLVLVAYIYFVGETSLSPKPVCAKSVHLVITGIALGPGSEAEVLKKRPASLAAK